MSARDKGASFTRRFFGGLQIDRRSFLTSSAGMLLDPPIPSRLRIRVAVFGDSASDGLWYALRAETPKGARYSL
ncbi:MAG TPA: hypothetical protein VE986_00595, partial [Hyphomicrobiales bacterium]|nr:hypothetical protein [Hyphomicrobiales bacterium]